MSHADPPASYPAPPRLPAAPLAYASGGMPAPYISARPLAKVFVGLSWAMLGEVPGPVTLVGGALSLAGVLVATLRWPSR